MMSGDNVSWIVLERGVEDVALLWELNKVFAILSRGPIGMNTSYPLLTELRRMLKDGLERIGP